MTHPNDHQVGGSHYASKKVQPWQAMEAWMSAEAFAGFLQGNCIKYLSRYRDKNGIEDLLKCQHYLLKLIEVEAAGRVIEKATDIDDGKVGYGRPPKHTRFKAGQSGNPRGRPEKSK